MSFPFPEEGLRVDELLIREGHEEDIDRAGPALQLTDTSSEAGLPSFDMEEIRVFAREQLPPLRASGALIPLVIEGAGGVILGGAYYSRFDPIRAAIEIGYWLFPAGQGRGAATRTARALAEHAFAQGVHRVHSVVRIDNKASERVLERAGFTREGILRGYLMKDGARCDATMFSLLADEVPR